VVYTLKFISNQKHILTKPNAHQQNRDFFFLKERYVSVCAHV